jgi:DNA-binding MarR family transcriptional regulator
VDQTDDRNSWTLLTAHGHVLVEIARNPEARMRDISAAAGITERATQAIVADLEAAGYLTRTRVGRRNRYTVHLDTPFRHAAQSEHLIGPFLTLLAAPARRDGATADTESAPRVRQQRAEPHC